MEVSEIQVGKTYQFGGFMGGKLHVLQISLPWVVWTAIDEYMGGGGPVRTMLIAKFAEKAVSVVPDAVQAEKERVRGD